MAFERGIKLIALDTLIENGPALPMEEVLEAVVEKKKCTREEAEAVLFDMVNRGLLETTYARQGMSKEGEITALVVAIKGLLPPGSGLEEEEPPVEFPTDAESLAGMLAIAFETYLKDVEEGVFVLLRPHQLEEFGIPFEDLKGRLYSLEKFLRQHGYYAAVVKEGLKVKRWACASEVIRQLLHCFEFYQKKRLVVWPSCCFYVTNAEIQTFGLNPQRIHKHLKRFNLCVIPLGYKLESAYKGLGFRVLVSTTVETSLRPL